MANVVGYSRVFAVLFLMLSNVSVLTNAAATPIRATALEKRAGEKIQIFDLENVCRISGATSVMINNTMWINGGAIDICYSPTNCTTWGDVSNYVIGVSFDNAYTNVSFANIDYRAMIKPRDVPVTTRGVLWCNGDGSKLFQFAGRITGNDSSPIQNTTADTDQLWSYTISTDTWEYLSQALSPSWDLYQVSIPEKDTAYSFGSIGGLPYRWESAVLQLNSTLEEDERLVTINTPPDDQDRGAMMYLSVPGSEGLLLVTGGSHATEDGSQPDVSLEYVMLYDIETKTWYNQSTSTDGPNGAYPNPRHNYCAQVVSTGNNSWDIFMYGGDYSTVYDKNTLNGLWILSIPTFRWFYFTNPSSAVPQSGTTCQVIGPHFIVFGGWNYWNVSPSSGPDCTEPFQIFNLNEWQWTKAFDPNASAYSAPTNVADYKAVNQAPIGGWGSGVQALFAGLNSTSAEVESSAESSNSTSSSLPDATGTAAAESSSSKLGPILGGVLGGLAGICAVLVGILMIIKRKKRAMAGGKVAHEIGDNAKIYAEMPGTPQQPPSELPADAGHYAPAGRPLEEPSELMGEVPMGSVKHDRPAGVR